MFSSKYQRLTLGLLISFLIYNPLPLEAAASLEQPGIQTEIGQEKSQLHIQKEDIAPVTANSTETSLIGAIHLDCEGAELGDYSKILAKYENRHVSIAELNELCKILTQSLRADGYLAAYVYLPPQTLAEGGTLRLAVLPGRYGQINIVNESSLPTEVARGYLAGLKQGQIVRSLSLETAMQKLTSLGGIKVMGMLAAGATTGTTDLTVRIKKDSVAHEVLYAENYGTTNAGRYRYGLQGDVQVPKLASAFNYAVVMSNGGQHNYNLNYSQRLGRSGTKLGLNISRGDYELGGAYRFLQAQGKVDTFSVNGSTPIYNGGRDSLNLSYGFNYHLIEDEQKIFNINMQKHSHSFFAGVNGANKRGKAAFDYGITGYWGRLGFDNFYSKLVYGGSDTEGSFAKTVFNASYLQTFDRHFDMLLKYTGQMATSNLDGSEEIVLGGINGVRAYPTGIGSGDEGYVANLEFRYHTQVPGLTLSTYLDMGHVKVTHDSGNRSYGGETAKGWGIGAYYTKSQAYFLRLNYARRIGGLSYYTNDKNAKDKDRIWFMLGKMF